MSYQLNKAVAYIKAGKIVAFPTETVYGLGADATNEIACQRIFSLKKRPLSNPLIIHVASLEQAERIGDFSEDAYKLGSLWPGPLTIVTTLKDKKSIANCALANLPTVALRVSSHPLALALINEAACPIAAPSANPSGYVSATLYEHVLEHFASQDIIALKAEDGCVYGLESTIVDVTSNIPVILRYGFIGVELIEAIVGKKVGSAANIHTIRAPGMLTKHYSTKIAIRLNAIHLQIDEIGLNFGESKLLGNYSLNLSEKGDLAQAASNLYAMLRQLDKYAENNSSIIGIAVAPIPLCSSLGIAINDRLKRAAA